MPRSASVGGLAKRGVIPRKQFYIRLFFFNTVILSTVRMADRPQPKKIPLIFFRTLAGSEPVREWLKELPEEERQAIGKDLLPAQWQWPIGMPWCRAMGSGPRGNPNEPSDETDGARVALPLP